MQAVGAPLVAMRAQAVRPARKTSASRTGSAAGTASNSTRTSRLANSRLMRSQEPQSSSKGRSSGGRASRSMLRVAARMSSAETWPRRCSRAVARSASVSGSVTANPAALAAIRAAASRSRRLRSRAAVWARAASLTLCSISWSNRSSASSRAMPSRAWNRAASVAVRRGSGSRARTVGRIRRAARASRSTTASGTVGAASGARASSRIASSRSRWRINSPGPKRRGLRRRSSRPIVAASPSNSASSRVRCSGAKLSASACHRRSWTRLRTRAQRRSTVLRPGSKTFSASSQVVARSVSRPRRSSPVQHRA